MKYFVKLLMFLIFFFEYSNAYAPHNPTKCSLGRYTGDAKCVKLVYSEVNERLDRAYKNILANITRVDAIEVVQEYASLLKTKNKICSKNPKNIVKANCETEEYLILNDETEMDCKIAKMDFCDFYEYHGDILKNIPEFNAATISKKYNSWLKSKNEFCQQYSDNEIKLKSCHIDYSIPKLNEFWEMESMLLEHPFEGKWISCSSPEGNFACRTYFAVEQDGNVCKGDWYRVNPNERHVVMSLERKYGNRVYPIKHCSLDNKGFANCNILEDGYDEHGRKTYKTSVPFSKWKDNRNEGERWMQGFYKKTFFSTSIKTPFLSGEREELIQTNKWLKDCLNYKGE